MPSNPTYDEVSNAFAPWRAQHKRDAYRPDGWVESKSAAVVQFGGNPHLDDGEPWPICSDCNVPLQLLIQLDLAELTKSLFPIDRGMLQLFYCIAEAHEMMPACNPAQHFSNGHEVRIVDTRLADASESQTPSSVPAFPVKFASKWASEADYPSAMELDSLGLREESTFVPGGGTTQMHWDAGDVHMSWDQNVSWNSKPHPVSHALEGDKISGWPLWVQGVEYPSCRICGAQMQVLMQLDSENNLPYMFGDCGCGHITFCKRHPHELAFGWACC